MQTSRLFGKYYLMTIAIVIAFIGLGFYVSRQLNKLNAPTMEGRHFVFDAKLLSEVDPAKREASVDKLNTLGARNHFEILTEDKMKNISDYPTDEFKFQLLEPNVGVIRLSGEPIQYLLVHFEGTGNNRIPWPLIHGLTALIISVILGIAFAMVIIFKTIEQKVILADDVIAQLQKGNLKARFTVNREDEMGRAMLRFNRMADEIERLVEQLRSTERARVLLLQELAHDLRTPVASLKNLLETVSKPAVPPELRDELFLLSLKEVEYFERLVEDLLILAQVSEPRYDQKQERIAINDLVKEEILNLQIKQGSESTNKKLKIQELYPADIAYVLGDAHLLRRMIRNALENAVSFAREHLKIDLVEDENNCWKLVFEDDGPGFSPDILRSFGERRMSRMLARPGQQGVRLSVGLGSVILKTVAQVHGGKIKAENKTSNSSLAGARVSIWLPRAPQANS